MKRTFPFEYDNIWFMQIAVMQLTVLFSYVVSFGLGFWDPMR